MSGDTVRLARPGRLLILALLALLAPAAPSAVAAPVWVPSWYASPEAADAPQRVLAHQTLRQIVRLSAGGDQLRIRLSNRFGDAPLRLDAVDVALRASGAAIRLGSSRAVTFQGHGDVTLAPGADVLSDPVALTVAPAAELAISVYAEGPATVSTVHGVQRNAVYAAEGNVAAAEGFPLTLPQAGHWKPWAWLEAVEVAGSPAKGVVVAFGDSITDGVGPEPDLGATWPDLLGVRLRSAGLPLSVVNAGIGGDRLLRNGPFGQYGDAGLARFDRDVLAQPQVRAVIVLIGLNDIGQVGHIVGLSDYETAEAVEDGLSQLAERAHEHGLKIFVATLTPFKGTIVPDYYSDPKEAEREAVNNWIRASRQFDGVADFAAAVGDPADPARPLPAYASRDPLHPNAAGEAAMAAAIPLAWFAGATAR